MMRTLPLVALTLVLACVPRAWSPSRAEARLPEAAVWGEWRGRLPEGAAGVIAGTVTGTSDGVAIPGVEIWILDAAGSVLARTTSDAQGAFRVDAPPRARIVAASVPGRAFFVEEIEAVWTETPRIAMDPAVTASGVVLGPDGTAIEGAEVWAIDMQRAAHWPAAVSRIVRSGPRGRFTIPDAPDGLIAVMARYPKLEDGRSFVQQAGAGRALTGMDVGLERRIVLRGTAERDGRPVADAHVAFLTASEIGDAQPLANAIGRADAKGRFELRVSPADGWVVATKDTLDGATWVRVEENDASASAVIELDAYERCRGRVVDRDGNPVEGAAVTLMYDWSAGSPPDGAAAMSAFRAARQRGLTGSRTGADGRFDFPMFAAGDDTVTVYVERADGADGTSASIERGTSADIELMVRHSLRGTIQDANQHALRARGVVTATGVGEQSRMTRTTRIEGGAFELEGLVAGDWNLIATLEGHQPGPPTRVVVTLERPAPVVVIAGPRSATSRVVRGRVRSADGTPLAGVRVSPGRALEWERAVRSGADGSFELSVPEGTGAIFLYLPEHASVVRALENGPAESAVDVVLTPGIATTQ